jgi:UDP-N-acetylmuramoylalanine--D-glutamate ligase
MKRRICILGGGESGVGAAILAKKQGMDVFLSDMGKLTEAYRAELDAYSIAWEEGAHTEEKIFSADEVIKSPGIPETAPLVKKLREKNIPVISEIEFASRYTKAKKICITGSNGKTTTTMLTYHILRKAGLNVGLAGNVGKSFAKQVAENEYDYYVLELSSFQLDGMYEFKAEIAILLNITPDHLDRYDYQMQRYVDSKFRITQNQGPEDALIYCLDDEETMKAMAKRTFTQQLFPFSIRQAVEQGAYTDNEHLNINLYNQTFTMTIQELALQGKHNLYNSMASGIAAKLIDIRNQSLKESLSDFKNIEHRLEHVAKIQDIDFINDSKATNVNSTWFALESMTNPVVWIVGGVDKGNDYSMLTELVRQKVRAIVCLGKDNSRIHEAFEDVVDIIVNTQSADEAAKVSYHLAKKGDTVLLSPACASFDLFRNYEDRGDQFKAAVKEL